MIAAGLQLMVLGMTIVFVFLIVLVFLMTVMGVLVRRFEGVPAATATATGSASGSSVGSSTGTYDTHIPAVLAAVAAHRSRTGRDGGSVNDTTTSKGASS